MEIYDLDSKKTSKTLNDEVKFLQKFKLKKVHNLLSDLYDARQFSDGKKGITVGYDGKESKDVKIRISPLYNKNIIGYWERHDVSDSDFINNVVDDFCEFVKVNDIDILRFRDEFKFVVQDEKRSLVAMCDVSNLDKFFDLINNKYGLKLEYPPTHVTLYTLPSGGIYLVDAEDIRRFTQPVDNPGLVLSLR